MYSLALFSGVRVLFSIKSVTFELLSIFEKRFIRANTTGLSINKTAFISNYENPDVIFLFWGKTSLSGGPGTALRLVKALLDKNVKVGVLVEEKANLEQIESFLGARKSNPVGWHSFKRETKFVLTNWQSYYGYSELRKYFTNWYMFVQDLEYLFFPHGSIHLIAREPYVDDKINKICLGSWLKENLVYSNCEVVRFPVTLVNETPGDVELDIAQNESGNEMNILCYIKHSFRRAGALMLMQLENLPYSINGVDINLKVVGYKPSWLTKRKYPKNVNFLGFIPEDELKDEINKSDVGVCYSVTNVSLLPYQFLALHKDFIEVENGGADISEISPYITYAKPSEKGLEHAIARTIVNSRNHKNNESVFKLSTIRDTADDFIKVIEE